MPPVFFNSLWMNFLFIVWFTSWYYCLFTTFLVIGLYYLYQKNLWIHDIARDIITYRCLCLYLDDDKKSVQIQFSSVSLGTIFFDPTFCLDEISLILFFRIYIKNILHMARSGCWYNCNESSIWNTKKRCRYGVPFCSFKGHYSSTSDWDAQVHM